VRGQHVVRRGHEVREPGQRIGHPRVRRRHLGQQVVEQRIEQVGLARDVAVDGVRGDAEPAGERPHRQGVGPGLVEDVARGLQDGPAAQSGALSGGSG
jgi:hypothetical protein